MSTAMQTRMHCAAVQPKVLSAASIKPAALTTALRVSPLRRQNTFTVANTRIVAKASSGEDVDFDKVLSDIADKFEKSDNKAAIVAYSAAAVGALWVSEWLIHLPGLNFLLGFPIQLLGLLLIPYFSVKYFVDNDSLTGDAGKAFDRVVKKLPGFDK